MTGSSDTDIDIKSFNKTVNEQTKQLQEQYDKIKSEHMVYSQKSNYQSEGLDTYIFANLLLFVIYYCIVIAIIYRLYSSVKYSRNIKFAIILLFVIYPYVISSIEAGIYNYFTYYYTLVTAT